MDSNYLLNGINSYQVNIAIDRGILATFEKFLLQSQPLLSNVFHFIEKNYQQSISLREVAQAVGRSPAYLTDLVRRETGKTVLNWIIERRMAEARRLLLETEESVERISEAVGYFDRRHFSRQFLKFHNATPQTWRRTNQSKSIPLWQIDPQKSSLNNLIDQKAATVSQVEVQRLQACVQEIAAILNKNSVTGEELILEGENSSVAKASDGSIKITLVSTLC
ncbi:AraC family transcriptional regulator [Aetokthonos hydrillicola Thurmond2011]|jgi:AraC-like DNA-binding protein|uniref:AraC family transcriptional regulator n=1 Tax=Aetokthonos hydrillicola Thurmond2011 TaxID=2712845 RepID=A0AAP5I6R6_9CYAN|nr:AraC family transcriptional regulator [Aetokthonos hydrillicola]MBO3459419.1 helix-turn-helix transcriptional regulator [Aetokthonos hydrillicola CCALA 1050]MBW4586565.1 AraC family transcriptional regulator [Aetokthonos hydrillicola CCALA 1050]MDR9893490.1 AraC family transcriptional regulator [Aetokthonos hydrillicola Thurmond2011]